MKSFALAILILCRYLPAIVDAINRGEAWFEVKIQLRKLDAALDKTEAQDDTRPLNDLFRKRP